MMTASSLLIKCVFVQKQGRIPVKWTAIEAMTGAMKYSTKSDVYVELTSLTGRMTSFYFEFTNEWLLK